MQISEKTTNPRVITYRSSWRDIAMVTVRRLEEDFPLLFEINILVKPRSGYQPQRWEITWLGNEKDIESNFWRYIELNAPEITSIQAAIGELRLPEGMKGLFEGVKSHYYGFEADLPSFSPTDFFLASGISYGLSHGPSRRWRC